MLGTNVLNPHQEQVIMTIQLVCFVGYTVTDRMFQFDLVFNAFKGEVCHLFACLFIYSQYFMNVS